MVQETPINLFLQIGVPSEFPGMDWVTFSTVHLPSYAPGMPSEFPGSVIVVVFAG